MVDQARAARDTNQANLSNQQAAVTLTAINLGYTRVVRSQNGNMAPLGTLVKIKETVGPALISLYNLYPIATIVGAPAQGCSSGEANEVLEQIAGRTLPPGTGYEWTSMSYQEKQVGNQIVYLFGFALLLVYLCLAGQYESWIAPPSVLMAVPLSLIGPASALAALVLANNLYTQIGLVLLIALSAKNAILIVEVARGRRLIHGESILKAATSAARIRFRPIIMTSFAFIVGVMPLVTATGAGANARASPGLSVLTGILASTCLAVLFVPSFFLVLRRFEEWLNARKSVPAPGPAWARGPSGCQHAAGLLPCPGVWLPIHEEGVRSK